MVPTRYPAAHAALWLPPLSLAGCVRCAMLRDTTAVDLAPEQRFNHYPATPLCTLTWWFSGTGETLEPGSIASLASPRAAPAARVLLSGPQRRPTVTWNPGPARGMMLMLMPDALHRLTGLDISMWVDKTVAAADALPADWGVMFDAVLSAPSEFEAWRLITEFFETRWPDTRDDKRSTRYRDWAEALAGRAATTSAGRSLRQIERRVRTWAGQPLRELRGFGRAENAFFDALTSADAEAMNLSDVAVDAGYFDQSHMNRAARRMTGFAPKELRRRIDEDEGFWAYRIWQ